MGKKFILAIVAVFFMCCNSSSENHQLGYKPTIQDEQQLRHIKEELWPRAYRGHDTLLLDQLLDDSFQMIDVAGGIYTKMDEMDWIKKNATQHDSFRYEIKRLDIYPNATAVVAGTGHIYRDSSYSIYQSSNVLIKNKESWRAVLSHVSGYREIK